MRMALQLIVEAFGEDQKIPKLYTCEGEDLSPSLHWTGAPEETRSFALIMDDPDAPAGTWNHWLIFDLPATVKSLPEGHQPGKDGLSGTNDFGRPDYGGPCPPKGHGPHRYFFKLYALDVPSLKLEHGAKRSDIDRAMQGHILAESQWMGRYERK
jgi:Raf kinase inhibitor-like YbhB/YbcL family protein